jgi:beta-glucanase (GH16 family)
MKKVLTIILGFVLLAVMAVGGYFLIQELNKGQAPEDTSAAGTRKTCPSGLALKQGECYSRDGKWKLTWNDEFTSSKVDAKKWYTADWKYPASDQLQYYTPQNVYTKNGQLVIKTEKRKVSKYSYASGWISTSVVTQQQGVSKNLFTQKYGKFEMYAKLPASKGVWPAFWLMQYNNSWPPEIDVMELLGNNPKKIYMTNHWKGTGGKHESWQKTYTGDDLSKGYHKYGVEWTSKRIKWFVDDRLVAESKNGIPNQAMYMIINTAVGGWAGKPNKTTVLPQYYYVDYVRVYKAV